ncbi:MAG: energy-coupling factor ABC transporter ATP-binding protein [Candidatus Rokuibacteriota bacterium]
MNGQPGREATAIRAERVSFSYTGDREVLDDVSLVIPRGQFVAFVGRNGSGKTTLVKHFNGSLRPARRDAVSRVSVYDAAGREHDTRRTPLHLLARVVGYVFQNPDRQTFMDTVRAELAFGLANIGVPPAEAAARMARALDLVQLAGLEPRNPFRLSRGQRQRVALAAVLVMEPDIIVVDEPTTGQDRRESRNILEILKEYNRRGRTVLIVTHDMALVAEYSDRVIVMRDGRPVADGHPRAVFEDVESLRSSNITAPQVTELGLRLGLGCTLRVSELTASLLARAGGKTGDPASRAGDSVATR